MYLCISIYLYIYVYIYYVYVYTYVYVNKHISNILCPIRNCSHDGFPPPTPPHAPPPPPKCGGLGMGWVGVGWSGRESLMGKFPYWILDICVYIDTICVYI